MRQLLLFFILLATTSGCGETLYEFNGKTLSLPFATDKNLDRVYEDFALETDITAFDEFLLSFDLQDAGAVGNVTLYFRSGDGWYSIATSPMTAGEQTLIFDKSQFMTEGTPAGLDKIDTIRISFWRGLPVDSSVKLGELRASTHSILFVPPEGRSEAERTAGANLQRLFRDNGRYEWVREEYCSRGFERQYNGEWYRVIADNAGDNNTVPTGASNIWEKVT